jgi:hypothetical protein
MIGGGLPLTYDELEFRHQLARENPVKGFDYENIAEINMRE